MVNGTDRIMVRNTNQYKLFCIGNNNGYEGVGIFLAKKWIEKVLTGCVRYIFDSLFVCVKESTCETRKNVFYFTSKALFILEIIKF